MQFVLNEKIREKTIVFPISFLTVKYTVSDAIYGVRAHLRIDEKNLSSVKLSCHDTDSFAGATSFFDLLFIGS